VTIDLDELRELSEHLAGDLAVFPLMVDAIEENAGGGGGASDEQVRDVMAATLVAGSNVTVTVDDPANTITIASSGGGGGGVPAGGGTGQVLAKASPADFDTDWVDQSGGGGGDVSAAPILAPGSSTRNVIEATGDFTELQLDAHAGQTEHILKVHDRDGALAVDIDAWGILDARSIAVQAPPDTGTAGDGTTSIRPGEVLVSAVSGVVPFMVTDAESFLGAYFRVNGPGAPQAVDMTTLATDQVGWVFSGPVGQTAPALIVWDSPFVVRLAQILANGGIVSNAHAAPADADLDSSSFSLWLDDTPGATCLKVKAKDSGGTVRTATVPLT